VIRGSDFEFRTANTNEWMRGTLAVYDTQPKQLVGVITAASVSQFVGHSALAIFELQNGTFTLAGNAPGNPVAPASLDARGTRRFVFKKQ
jgi:hypothetical protein